MAYRRWNRRQPRPLWRSLVDLALFLIVLTATLIMMNKFNMIDLGTGNVEVVDGDSLRRDGVDIRLQGLDAPEYTQHCRDAQDLDYACGKEARLALVGLTRGQQVDCQSVETDQYGRALSTCKIGETDIGREMVRQGWAIAYRSLRYVNAENEARKARKGLWAGRFEKPSEFRARQRVMQGSAATIDTDTAGDGAARED